MNHQEKVKEILLYHEGNPENEISAYIERNIESAISKAIFFGIAILVMIGLCYLCTTQS